ncbi:putative transcriptional regulator [Escherichia coli]|nr:putative transcriptional regulator [Escherichia coli]
MMSLWDALRMNMMISYQELVRTFPKEKPVEGSPLFLLQMCTEQLVESGKFDMRQDGA